jgi:hypothetical protein
MYSLDKPPTLAQMFDDVRYIIDNLPFPKMPANADKKMDRYRAKAQSARSILIVAEAKAEGEGPRKPKAVESVQSRLAHARTYLETLEKQVEDQKRKIAGLEEEEIKVLVENKDLMKARSASRKKALAGQIIEEKHAVAQLQSFLEDVLIAREEFESGEQRAGRNYEQWNTRALARAKRNQEDE